MKKLLLIFILAFVLIGCIFQSQLEYEHPLAYEITPFACESQPDSITCGPTSAAMVLSWYGYPHTCQTVQGYTKTKWFEYDGEEIGMTVPEYIVGAMERLGVETKLRHGKLSQLKHFVSQNKPVIVLVRSGEFYLHYCVVIGFDENYITIADPSGGQRRVLPVKHFLGAWQFSTDLEGTAVGYICPVCNGEGSYEWFNFNVSCDLCGGNKRLDPLKTLLKEAGVQPCTMIVPQRSKNE
jgi:hypothetical protein